VEMRCLILCTRVAHLVQSWCTVERYPADGYEGNISIYVDTSKSGFAIPQHVGKKVLVEGTLVIKESGPMIQGRGVEVR